MSQYGKKKQNSQKLRIQNLKEYQKIIYHNANLSFNLDISVKGKLPNGKYDIDLSEMKECLLGDFAHYLPLEDHDGKVYEGEEYHDVSTIPGHDIEEFIMSLNQQQFGMLINFFNTMPKLRHVIPVTNPKTQVESEVVVEGLASFLV